MDKRGHLSKRQNLPAAEEAAVEFRIRKLSHTNFDLYGETAFFSRTFGLPPKKTNGFSKWQRKHNQAQRNTICLSDVSGKKPTKAHLFGMSFSISPSARAWERIGSLSQALLHRKICFLA